jgi:signal transduction histidine kinase
MGLDDEHGASRTIELVVLVVSSALIFAGVWFFDRQLVVGVHETIDETLDARAAPLVALLADASGPVDRSFLTGGVVSIPALLAHVIGPDATVVASSLGSPHDAAAMLSTELLGQLDRRRYVVVTTDLSPMLEEIRVLTVPVDRTDGTWAVVVGSSLEITERAQSVRTGFIVGGVVAVAMTTVGAWLLVGAALAPVERMRRTAALITAGDDDAEIAEPGRRNELAGLAATFNELLRRMRAALTGERRLVADASHELRTPLAVLRTELELAARPGRSVEELRRAIDNAHVEAARLSRLADDLLLLARSEEGSPIVLPEQHDVATVLDRAVAAIDTRAAQAAVGLSTSYRRPLSGRGDPRRLRQAVDNLLDNALRYTPPAGTIVLAAEHHDGTVDIRVADNGPGFPAEFLAHAFTAFHRADPAHHRHSGGAGLGLAIARTIAVAHGGEATAANLPEGGAVVTLTIPQ